MNLDLPPDIKLGAVLDNLLESIEPTSLTGLADLTGPTRIIGLLPQENKVWLIDFPRKSKSDPNQMEYYVGSPRCAPLSDLVDALNGKLIYKLNLTTTSLTDDQRRSYCGGRALKSLEKDFKRRDKRYEVLRPLLQPAGEGTPLRSALEMLRDTSLPKQIRKRAKACGRSPATLYCWLNRYWALGSKASALESGFGRCGNPGHPKAQQAKLGRGTRLFNAGRIKSRGYALDKGGGKDAHEDLNSDKQKLAFFYRLIKHDVSRRDAYLMACSTYWAEHEIQPDGSKKVSMLPKWERPTFGQFIRWGKILNDDRTVTEILLGVRKFSQRFDARGGSVQDVAAVVGQRGVFDATSTDVFLTSFISRLKKLPAMTRSLIKDVGSTLIVGLNCSWEPPSPNTAMKTILHAASSKVEFCRRFGIIITEDEWPAILHRTYTADHGEMKGHAIDAASTQFGFGLNYPPTMRGDLKGDIESQHHTDHKMLDEKAPGNTAGGTHTKRGEEHAAQRALWNYYEYMRELIWHILEYNNQEVPDFQPLAMLRENPEIRPTRLNIFNWLRTRLSAEISCDVDELRAFMLPDHKAIIRKNGVYLTAKVHGREQILPRMRFTSPALMATNLLSEVRRRKEVLHVLIKLDEADLTVAWLPTKSGMIKLNCAVRDSEWRRVTLADWVSIQEELQLDVDLAAGTDEQFAADKALRRQSTTHQAKGELAKEMDALDAKPSKKSFRDGLRGNLAEEMKRLRNAEKSADTAGFAPEGAEPDGQPQSEPVSDRQEKSAASRAMEMANEEEFQ
ncbi:putative transposon Tn7 transposition protein TnsB [Variovorax paradoxus B4]|uniref:Putative transposon Tn7 transposition protein TnsB n=1 Tax=Variovorax paradoxus B4 TaxID=1246301 RepID=T1X5Q4_VARPD|nr:hypothetical protein [Variovorax paradoxus]AGU47781.1 putative transposon Tn7 transposition protein TnsB [Variovorax paradoxus B4]